MDQDAFARDIFEPNRQRLDRVASRLASGTGLEPDDLVSETYVRAVKGIDDFRYEAKPYTWLHRILTNVFLDEQRRPYTKRRQDVADFDVTAAQISTPASQLRRLEQQQEATALARAITTLRPDMRAAFDLRYVEGLSVSQVADTLGVNLPVAKSRVHRAKVAVRKATEAALAVRPPSPKAETRLGVAHV